MTAAATVPVRPELYALELESLGPAMRKLPPMQRQFVIALIQLGVSQQRAAELAGYKGNRDTLKAVGYRLAHDPRVQAAIQEEAQKLIRTHSVMAIGVLAEVAMSPSTPPRDRVKAAEALLNRSGLSAVSETRLTVDHKTDEEVLTRIRSLADLLGVDPDRLLGRATSRALPPPSHAYDAEFEVISSAPSAAEPELSPAGLEDLLGEGDQ